MITATDIVTRVSPQGRHVIIAPDILTRDSAFTTLETSTVNCPNYTNL